MERFGPTRSCGVLQRACDLIWVRLAGRTAGGRANSGCFVLALERYRVAVVPVILALFTWGSLTSATAAQHVNQSGGDLIEAIRIEGTQRIEPQTVKSYIPIDIGDPFDPVTGNRALKALFATRLFADVTLRREESILVVLVRENPIINRVAFEGNGSIDDEILEGEITLQPRVVFTRTAVQQDLDRILAIYRATGRFGATVVPKIIELEQNRVDLVFEIDEGEITYVVSINFIGNRFYSDGELREEIASSETAFWRILSATDTYDPDRLTFDRELLRRFYLSEGFADFRVLSSVSELTPDRAVNLTCIV